MKEKLIGDKLYFQELEAQVITTTATTVYVQNNLVAAFKELNPDLNIQPINYKVLAVNKPFWYVEEENNSTATPTEQEPYTPSPTEQEPYIPSFVSMTYSFISYNSDHSVQYGGGTVETVESDQPGYVKVQVTANEFDSSFIGRYFYVVDTATPNDENFYVLYEQSTGLIDSGVAVKIYSYGTQPTV